MCCATCSKTFRLNSGPPEIAVKRTISFVVPEDIRKMMEIRAKQDGVSKSEVFRRACIAFLEPDKHQEILDALELIAKDVLDVKRAVGA